MSRVVVVTGTSTGVGKTVTTAAVAALAGPLTVVVKPVQTGTNDGGPSDLDELHRLSGCEGVQFAELPEPLAPDTAARLRRVTLPPVAEHARRVRDLAESYTTVVVEGAGGLLVRLDTDGGTLLDLAAGLQPYVSLEVLVVVAPALGTLNHTELTVAALRGRGLEPAGLVIGAWPAAPGLVERCNADDLPRVTGVPVVGVVPEGAGRLAREEFVAGARGWFAGLAGHASASGAQTVGPLP